MDLRMCNAREIIGYPQAFISRMEDISARTSLTIRRSYGKESGQTLPAVLWVLAIGALLMSPFLTHVSTSLLAGKDLEGEQREQYAADSGVEFGVWKLLNDATFRSQVDASPGTPVAVDPSITVNQLTTNITATALSSGGSSGWESMAPGTSFGSGASLAHDGNDYIYALGGNRTMDFWRYSISGNSWSTLADVTGAVKTGASLAYTGGDYIYALHGDRKKLFYRYSISGDSWTSMADTPDSVKDGGALTYAGGDTLYAFQGNRKSVFWAYSISGNSWSSLANAPAAVKAGGALTYADGDYIYAFPGNGTTDFWRYSISGNSWTPMTSAPAGVNKGGALTYGGGDYLYAFRGNTTTDFWSYSISGDSWTALENTLATVTDGGALAYAGSNSIYATRGGGLTDFWRYSIGSGPPSYDVISQAGDFSITTRVEIDTGNVTVLSWDIN
jgi:hypothetical protein